MRKIKGGGNKKRSETGLTRASLCHFSKPNIHQRRQRQVKPVADWAKATGAKQFFYVSSAGMYIPTDVRPTGERREDRGGVGFGIRHCLLSPSDSHSPPPT